MLRANRKSNGQSVIAYSESKSNGPFLCPECNEEVILKGSKIGDNHFAHANAFRCGYAGSESELHRRCKTEIYEALQREPGVTGAVLERSLSTVRPDVSVYIRGVPVAIEVQISSLSPEMIHFRTTEYARKGIYVLWLLPWTPRLDRKRYSPTLWEKWIHAAYFGHVYYWLTGLSIASYHFEASLRTVPRKSWYSEDGKKMTTGGYSQRSKRHRTVVRGETLNLANDFRPKDRDWWKGGGITIPPSKLFISR